MKRLTQYGFTVWLTVIFVFVTAGIAFGGWLYYGEQRRITRQQRVDELTAIADLKVSQIETWRAGLIEDGAFLQDGSLGGKFAARFLEAPSEDLRKTVADWMSRSRSVRGYDEVTLLDAQGQVRLSTSNTGSNLQPADVKLAMEAIASNTVVLSDIGRNRAQAIRMTLLVPLAAASQRRPVGALFIKIDPVPTLYPLIQDWPTPSRTSETALIRQEGNEAVFL